MSFKIYFLFESDQLQMVLLHRYLRKADTVKLVSDEEYKPWLMQKRNEYMVDLADKVIAVLFNEK